MMMNEPKEATQSLNYVFKVLSGPLKGIEFLLAAQNYFVCVGNQAEMPEEFARSLESTDRSLYLPAVGICHNFSVNLGQNLSEPNLDDEDRFEVTVHYLTHQETITLELNAVCQIGGVHFALKHEGQPWSQTVLGGVLPAPVNVDAQITAPASVTAPVSKAGFKWGKKLVAACLALLCFGSAAAWLKYHHSTDVNNGSKALEELMGKQVGYSVQLGRDGIYYIFAQNSQQAEWAKQAVARAKSDKWWKVVTPQEEEARLARVLERSSVNFFVIRFADPRVPTLVMNSKNNSVDARALDNITKTLLEALPYARTVHIELYDNQDLIRSAQEGLMALGFDYQMVQSDQGVTLVSHMSSGDARMAEFSRYADQFYRTWGRRYVHFSVELRDESLKGKSFKYGRDGYVNMGQSHWLFDNNNE